MPLGSPVQPLGICYSDVAVDIRAGTRDTFDTNRRHSMAEEAYALNRTLFIADNLQLMGQMDNETVDLICTDPPFAKNQTFKSKNGLKPALTEEERAGEKKLLEEWGITSEMKADKIGVEWPDRMGGGAAFEDIWDWEDIHEAWMLEIQSDFSAVAEVIEAASTAHSQERAAYCAYMAIRLIEMHRILKPTGSIFLHCDWEANSYLRLLMDAIFGKDMYINEIAWCYPPGGQPPKNGFPKKHDTILFYAKNAEINKFIQGYTPLDEKQIKKFTKTDERGRRFKQYKKEDKIYKTFLDEHKGSPVPSWWTDIHSLGQAIGGENTGYPTQKPVALAERIIKSSTDKSDIVFDPFAGCAYTLVAAERNGRQWIGCDFSARALTVLKRQFAKFGYSPNGEMLDNPKTGATPMLSEVKIDIKGPTDSDMPARSPDSSDEDPVAVPAMKPRERKYKAQAAIHTREEMLNFLLGLSGWRAWCCGWYNPGLDGKPREDIHNFELDHINPKSKEGHNHQITNRAPLCPMHNRLKGNRRIHLDDLREEIRDRGELYVYDISELIDLTMVQDATLNEYARKKSEFP